MKTLMQTRKGTALAVLVWVGDTVALVALWNVHGILMLLPIIFFVACFIGGMGLIVGIVVGLDSYQEHAKREYESDGYNPPYYLPLLMGQVELNTLDGLNKRRERMVEAIHECRDQAKLYDELDPRHITLTAQADHLQRLSVLVFENIERVRGEIEEARRERRYKQLTKGE